MFSISKLTQLKQDVKNLSNPVKAKTHQRFFKTGKGDYGEGDIFLGLTTPQSRTIAKKYQNLPLSDLAKLIQSKIHEHRFIALVILIHQFQKTKKSLSSKKSSFAKRTGSVARQEIYSPQSLQSLLTSIYNFYLNNTAHINNWDLVDISAPKIIGQFLLDNPHKKPILKKLAKSKSLWERRIAIISTFTFIRNNKFIDTLEISEILVNDRHDLIHKAVGWMLRELGKKNQPLEEKFLKKHLKNIPRTMLRYAIEKFPESKRQHYLHS
jgi:3-methyladenine DNA glycosylase AlkD